MTGQSETCMPELWHSMAEQYKKVNRLCLQSKLDENRDKMCKVVRSGGDFQSGFYAGSCSVEASAKRKLARSMVHFFSVKTDCNWKQKEQIKLLKIVHWTKS